MEAIEHPKDRGYNVFLSDSHVPVFPGPCPRYDRFLSFLASMDPAPDHLFLLGDIFEFWYEYETVIFVSHFPLLHRLACLKERGTRIHLVTGNHDFWAGPQFQSLLSATLSYDTEDLFLSERRVFLCHGDGFAPEDGWYRLFRRILRSGFAMWCMGRCPPGLGARIADRLSKYTRSRSRKSDDKDHKALKKLAAKKIGDGVDIFLCAHLHSPEIEEIHSNGNTGLFLNLGDWWEHDTYVVERRGIYSLHWDGKDDRPWC